ncbi:S1 RNA-binding domain-containing protein [Caldicoprobacter faecalis]|uniref:S1 RNA binding domain protein n=1 Tax=Caldicoprobacter faecalis TaxID=937334 RepID=A0A1I5Y8J2_9FIRM|nr:S1 RNA-binding domain-containing protein [Caldicoprobacter faecalis]SFQ40525.1 S1 RNA binding domain protein [Caldicoprobacter faecalis]
MPVEVGQIIEGRVSGITKFGAFIVLPDGQTGMVHISEIADTYVKDIHQYLKQDDRVMVKVLSIDERGRINLSIRRAREKEMTFEERLAKFMKESEEKLQDIKRNREAKRGGGHWRGRR